jgi:hypothetical protein
VKKLIESKGVAAVEEAMELTGKIPVATPKKADKKSATELTPDMLPALDSLCSKVNLCPLMRMQLLYCMSRCC